MSAGVGFYCPGMCGPAATLAFVRSTPHLPEQTLEERCREIQSEICHPRGESNPPDMHRVGATQNQANSTVEKLQGRW